MLNSGLRAWLALGRSQQLALSQAAIRGGAPALQIARGPRACTSTRASTSQASSAQSTGSASGQPDRVVILGGGFGGLYAAIKLSNLFWPKNKTPQITVVDRAERFSFKPLMYDALNGTASEEEVAPGYAQVLAPYPVRFLQAKVVSVEEDASAPPGGKPGVPGKVQLEGGATLEYDWLVVGLGSETDTHGIPGVKECALPFNTYEDVVKVKAALEAIEAERNPASTVMVVGAGYAGVELASTIAERMEGKARVMLVTPRDDILDGCPEGQRLAARKALTSMGAEILTGSKVRSMSRPNASSPQYAGGLHPTSTLVEMQVSDGGPYEQLADLVLWTAGASPVTKDSKGRKGLPFPYTSRGAIQTEPTLRVHDHARVFALGDVSGPETTSYEQQGTASQALAQPATAQVALQQADFVAWNIWASINGRTLLPFRYQHLGNMMSLGQLNAAVALPVPVPVPIASTLNSSPLGPLLDFAGIKLGGDDPESGVTVEGPLAQAMRRAAYLYRQPTNEQRLTVASTWLQQALSMATGQPLPRK